MKITTRLIAVILLTIWMYAPATNYAQISMNAIPGIRPSTYEINDIEKTLESLNTKIANGGYVFEHLQSDISAADKKIQNIKTSYKKYKKTSTWETQLATINDQFNAAFLESEITTIIKDNNRNIENFRASPTTKFALTLSNIQPSFDTKYTEYNGLKEEHKNPEHLTSLNSIKQFYTDELPSTLNDLVKKDLEEDMKSAENQYKNEPQPALSKVKKALDLATNTRQNYPSMDFTEQVTKLNDLRSTIETYIANGGAEKAKIDARMISKPVGSFPAEEALIKQRLVDLGYGEIVIVTILDKAWDVSVNDLGVPQYKSKFFNAATKQNGKCYLLTGSFRKSYEGNGTYSSGGFFYHPLKGYYPQQLEMNCENLNKRK